MKRRIVIGGLALLVAVAGCQSEEVTLPSDEPIKRTGTKQVIKSSYEEYERQYKSTMQHIKALQSELDEREPYHVKMHYEKRVALWKRYMNKLLDELHYTQSEEQWKAIQQQQAVWYRDMEQRANDAAKQSSSNELIAYLTEKEIAIQQRARYILDTYYFNEQQ